MMNRRDFLSAAAATTLSAWLPASARAATAGRYENLLILIELKGGNDGLNTVIPYADPLYPSLRPRLAIPRDQVLQLDAAVLDRYCLVFVAARVLYLAAYVADFAAFRTLCWLTGYASCIAIYVQLLIR